MNTQKGIRTTKITAKAVAALLAGFILFMFVGESLEDNSQHAPLQKNAQTILKIGQSQIIKDTIKYLNGYPDICFGKNYEAPLYCKKIFYCYTVYNLTLDKEHAKVYTTNPEAGNPLVRRVKFSKETLLEAYEQNENVTFCCESFCICGILKTT